METGRTIRPITLEIEGYLDNVERVYKQQPFYFDENGIYWFWYENKWKMVDEVEVMNTIDDALGFLGKTIKSSVKYNYLEAVKRFGRKNKPKDPPKHWIQFNDMIYDLKTGNTFKTGPDYFFVNRIPWNIGTTSETPILDKLISSWVGEKYLKTMYQLISYCCYRDNPIHNLFFFIGSRRNGKGQCMKLIDKFIGKDNSVTSTAKRLSEAKFSNFPLWKKLVCHLSETSDYIESSDNLKAITGNDSITYEKKGMDEFTDKCYCTIIAQSNQPPIIKDPTLKSRIYVFDFPNTFPEGKDIYESVPDFEFEALAKKVTELLPGLLELGKYDVHRSLEEKEKLYDSRSNPLPEFVELCCDVNDVDGHTQFSELYKAYVDYLKIKWKTRSITNKGFSTLIRNMGYELTKCTINNLYTTYVFGVKLNQGWREDLERKTTQTTITPESVVNPPSLCVPMSNAGVSGVSVVLPRNSFIKEQEITTTNPKNKDFVDILGKFLEIVHTYQETYNFLKEVKMEEHKIENFIENNKRMGLIMEIKPGFLQTVK